MYRQVILITIILIYANIMQETLTTASSTMDPDTSTIPLQERYRQK